MAGEESRSSGFRVVDRRPFAPDGSRREGPAAGETKDEAAPERRPSKPGERGAARAPSATREPSASREPSPEFEPQSELGDDRYEDESPGFETLVSYLSTTAMFQLGLIPGPSGEHLAADMPNAKRTIDLLEVLQDKTQGNLSARESRLLENVLYELRMSFVQMQKRQARKSK